MGKAVRSPKHKRRRRREFYLRKRAIVWAIKVERQCADCPDDAEWPPYVLQFDHVRGEKLASIADMLSKNWSTQTILDEIKKCEVVCANHHAMRSQERIPEWENYEDEED